MFWRRRKRPFIEAAIRSLLGQQMISPSYSAEAGLSLAHIALTVAASIGYKFPSKAPSIYIQEFGKKGQRVYGEMVGAINKWAEEESTPLSDLNELPILKIPYDNLQRLWKSQDRQGALNWTVFAFRYGCVLGASHRALFRDLWINTQRRERLMIQEMRKTNIPVPDDVAAYEDPNFDDFVDEAAGFLEFYESNIGPLPSK